MPKQTFTIGSFAIIFNDKKQVLLNRRPADALWNLPGGGVEDGESPWEAVIREVKEETNLEVKVDKLLGIYFKPEKNDLVFSFLCSVTGGQIALSDEADKIEYFSLENLPDRLSKKQIERIRDAFEFQGEIILKNQYGPSSIDLVKQGKL